MDWDRGCQQSSNSTHSNGGTGDLAFHLCRCPTWKRVAIDACLFALMLVTAGCTFEDHSRPETCRNRWMVTTSATGGTNEGSCPSTGSIDTGGSGSTESTEAALEVSQWTDACTEPSSLVSGVAPPGLVIWWRFDGSDPQGLLDPTLTDENGALPQPSQNTRINGTGSSVNLDGSQFLESDIPDSLVAPSTITVSAWISLSLDDLTGHGAVIWPIVSTMGAGTPSCGYQLDIRLEGDGTGPELVFTYAYPEQSNGTADHCPVRQLKHVLNDPSWAWGLGRWHHVAVTYAQYADIGEEVMALYSNGNQIGTSTSQSSPLDALVNPPAKLYVGTNEASANAPGTARYKGYVDDIAIFNLALSEKEISDFAEQSSTSAGPSGCRWRADEAWDFATQSNVSLDSSSFTTDGSILLTVNDNGWGYGRLRAHLSPHLDLSRLNAACLDATIYKRDPKDPENITFEFGLSSGDGYCVWFLDRAHRVPCGRQDSNKNSYEIDLTNPNYCGSTNCAFDIDGVQEAWIASDWGSAEDGVNFAVRGLTFGKSERNIDYPHSYGGTTGPLGWCWRPQSTDPGTSATWESPLATTAKLHGPTNTTVRLVADFVDNWVDISKCTTVRIDASLPSSCQYAFVLLDAHGAQFQWGVIGSGPATYDITLDYAPKDQNFWTSNFNHNLNCEYYYVPDFDPRLVRMLGIQRSYGSICDVRVAVSDVKFLGKDGQENCAIWTCQ